MAIVQVVVFFQCIKTHIMIMKKTYILQDRMNLVIATYIRMDMLVAGLDGTLKKSPQPVSSLLLMLWSLTCQWFTQVVFILQNVTGCSGASWYVYWFVYSVLRLVNIVYVCGYWNAKNIYTCHFPVNYPQFSLKLILLSCVSFLGSS